MKKPFGLAFIMLITLGSVAWSCDATEELPCGSASSSSSYSSLNQGLQELSAKKVSEESQLDKPQLPRAGVAGSLPPSHAKSEWSEAAKSLALVSLGAVTGITLYALLWE